jgi:hypothetical protein
MTTSTLYSQQLPYGELNGQQFFLPLVLERTEEADVTYVAVAEDQYWWYEPQYWHSPKTVHKSAFDPDRVFNPEGICLSRSEAEYNVLLPQYIDCLAVERVHIQYNDPRGKGNERTECWDMLVVRPGKEADYEAMVGWINEEELYD